MAQRKNDSGLRAGIDLLALLDKIDPSHIALACDDVHNIRVAIKQTRAWLKLCRGLTGQSDTYIQLLDKLRTLSASLAGQRDRDVARLTLARLVRKYPGKKARLLVTTLDQQLAQHSPLSPQAVLDHATLAQLREALLPYTQLEVPPVIQLEVLHRTSLKMCQAGDIALNSEACHDLHAWRKLVKTAGYQMTMIDADKTKRHKLHARLSRLGSKLGLIHDLCFLQAMLEEMAGQLPRELDLAPLFKRIGKERGVLLEAVHKLHRYVCHPFPQLTVPA